MLDKLWLLLSLITAICIIETYILWGGGRWHIAPKTRTVTGGLKKERRLELGHEEGRTWTSRRKNCKGFQAER